MPKRPPGKGKGADIFLSEQDTPSLKKRRTPKGQGADVFLGAETSPQQSPQPPQPKRPPLVSPTAMAAALDQACLSLAPSHGRLDRSHLLVMLWLRVALKEAGF
jgi:hypothetical protein